MNWRRSLPEQEAEQYTRERGAAQATRYAQIDAARDAEIQRLIAEAEAEDEPHTDAEILQALRTYDGPLNKRGLPPRRALNAHAEFKISGDDKRRLWPVANASG